MYDYKEQWKDKTASAINELFNEAGINEKIESSQITAENPPDPGMGDIGFPMFAFAKTLRKGPPQIAQMAAAKMIKILEKEGSKASVQAQGPYLNIRMDRGQTAKKILENVLSGNTKDRGGFTFGRPETMAGKKVMVEFSSPNTNKPLHLGHLRNDVLGESIARIIKACGAQVRKVCIINDRGIHICKSMYVYKNMGQGKTPESENIKSDHFVGDWYIAFNDIFEKEVEVLIDKGHSKEEAEKQAQSLLEVQKMLRDWEAGDSGIHELWKKMNFWAFEGIKKTYERTGISFDRFDFESETYKFGKEEVLKGLENGIFYRQDDGAVAVDLSEEKLDKKILLRSDGTSIYITQDFGTAINRHKDWPFDQLIYVVGSEQQYHFKVLFSILDKLGYTWSKDLYHLSYGMIYLPEGVLKTRKGPRVDADDLIDSLRAMALAEIREKGREEDVGNPEEVAEKIALGALHYFLLQTSPVKDMLFNPKESLSFTGNTGPYLQYMGARISSMLRKKGIGDGKKEIGDRGQGLEEDELVNINSFTLLTSDSEWELVKSLASYPFAVSEAAASLDPSRLAGYLYELSKAFSRFYHECPILTCEDAALSAARLELSRAVMMVLKDAFGLVCIPFLEVM